MNELISNEIWNFAKWVDDSMSKVSQWPTRALKFVYSKHFLFSKTIIIRRVVHNLIALCTVMGLLRWIMVIMIRYLLIARARFMAMDTAEANYVFIPFHEPITGRMQRKMQFRLKYYARGACN